MAVSGQFHLLAPFYPEKNIPYPLDIRVGRTEISVLSPEKRVRVRAGYRILTPWHSIPYSSLILSEVHQLHTGFSLVH